MTIGRLTSASPRARATARRRGEVDAYLAPRLSFRPVLILSLLMILGQSRPYSLSRLPCSLRAHSQVRDWYAMRYTFTDKTVSPWYVRTEIGVDL